MLFKLQSIAVVRLINAYALHSEPFKLMGKITINIISEKMKF